MDWLEKIRYFAAVLVYSSVPAAVLYWYLIHPFASFWKRLGAKRTFTLVGAICLVVVAVLAAFHEQVLAASYPFRGWLAVIGLGLYAVAAALEVSCRRHLKFAVLAGVPEVSGDPGQLLTEGIYSRIRNPRYLSILFGLAALALILNYPALYLLFVVSIPAIYGIILLEERELRQRFGAEYEEYVRRVPRLIPRLPFSSRQSH